jgi:hypothetical protein
MKPNDGGQNHILADAITSGFPPSGRRDFMYREVAQWRHIRRRQKRPLKLRC